MKLTNWGLADALRAAGLVVRETNGWQNRDHGQISDIPTVVWHHDASPPGDSPGALQWMIDNWNKASANIWINRQGVVYLVGAGYAFHAGAVNDVKFSSSRSIGIELDLTVGEQQTGAQLSAVRLATAVMLRKSGRTAQDGLGFHRTICKPKGRKVDPYGLDLISEQVQVQLIMNSMDSQGRPLGHTIEVSASPAPSVPSTSNPAPEPAPANTGPYGWAPTYPGLLKKGSEGDAVKLVQTRLNHAHIPNMPGFKLLTIDGDFGKATDAAIREFQKYRSGPPHNLGEPDGIVGPKTHWSLWN